MNNFLRYIPYGRLIPVYKFLLLSLTVGGFLLGFGNLGFNFSIPVTLTVLIIDLCLIYQKYKEWPRN